MLRARKAARSSVAGKAAGERALHCLIKFRLLAQPH